MCFAIIRGFGFSAVGSIVLLINRRLSADLFQSVQANPHNDLAVASEFTHSSAIFIK
jgi:hypothetical protein